MPSLSPGPSAYWLWDVQTVTLKCILQSCMLCKKMSPEVLSGEMEVEDTYYPLCTLYYGILIFALKQMGVLFMGDLLGCGT